MAEKNAGFYMWFGIGLACFGLFPVVAMNVSRVLESLTVPLETDLPLGA